MKMLYMLSVMTLATTVSAAGTELMTVKELKEFLATNYNQSGLVDFSDIKDDASCKEVDQYLARHSIQAVHPATNLILEASQFVKCEKLTPGFIEFYQK